MTHKERIEQLEAQVAQLTEQVAALKSTSERRNQFTPRVREFNPRIHVKCDIHDVQMKNTKGQCPKCFVAAVKAAQLAKAPASQETVA